MHKHQPGDRHTPSSDGHALPDSTDAMTQRRAMLTGIGGLAAGALLAGKANAGPLNPPAGPIEPTMKRLDEVEPRIPVNTLSGSSNSVHRISLPGSYYLTGDIVGEPGKSGIQVVATAAAGQVVIDLNGYRIRGVDGSFVGITVLGTNPRLVIRNGQINAWGWNGVNANCPMVLEDLRIEGNGQGQESHGGARGSDTVSAQVRRCVFASNNGDGLRVGDGSTVEQCIATENSGSGISTSSYCVVSHCDSRRNQTGIACADDCVVRSVTSARNSFSEILVSDRCEVSGCICSQGFGIGIWFGSSCRIYSNTCSDCLNMGFLSNGDSSVVHDNTAIRCLTRGFEIFGFSNIVVRNFSASNSGSTGYVVTGENVFGPVVGISDIANNCNPHANLRTAPQG